MSYLDPNSINGDSNNYNNEEEDVSSNIEYQIQQQMEFVNYNNHNNNQYSTTSVVPDLLNLCPGAAAASLLPLPNPSLSFTDASLKGIEGGEISMESGATGSTILMHDPLFHLNLPPPQPLSLGDLFQALPTPGGNGLSGARGCSLFGSSGGGGGGDDHGEVSVDGLYQVGGGSGGGFHHFDNGVLEFSRDMVAIGEDSGKVTKHYTTERHRRVQMNDKFKALRSLVPSPTKDDRASIVGDAIEYIKELRRTVNELKLLVDKKRCGRREGIKRQKTEEDAATGDVESSHDVNPLGDPDQSYGALRSSWLQRKSKDTEVDVRIIDDEVTVKLVQRKKINCLLLVSKVLDELQLDLHHVAGGVIGEYYSFMFNTKIYEGSSVYASAIANKLIEVVDKQYASAPPTNCY